LTAALEPWLEPQEVRALLARRERLLETYRDDGTPRFTPR
jgi:hypothetical protein